jgi:hypothetical protein
MALPIALIMEIVSTELARMTAVDHHAKTSHAFDTDRDHGGVGGAPTAFPIRREGSAT